MTTPVLRSPITYEEYRARERLATTKSEFVGGEIFAMSGARRAHNQIAMNIAALLWNAFRERPCLVYGSDMRVRTGDDIAAYPDVVATCSRPRFSDDVEDELLNPMTIVEVLSDSTEAYDRGDKFEHYTTIASLREYVLVSAHKRRVEVFRRAADGTWILNAYTPGASVPLESLGVALGVDDIYRRALDE